VLSGNIFFWEGLGAPVEKHAQHLRICRAKWQMDTDTIMGVSAAVALAVCGICVVWRAWYESKRPHLKVSRSDPDLENLQDIATDSLPTH
jgi:hypothetical protein